MKTTSKPTAIASRVLLALGATALLSSCSLPPRQAWTMIQRDGLFNYWAYASGHQPTFGRPSPPLQRSSHSLAYRPSNVRYLQDWNTPISRNVYVGPTRSVAPQPLSRSSSSQLSSNRCYAPVTSIPAPRPKTSRSKSSSVASRKEPTVNIPVEPPSSKPSSSNSSPDKPVASEPKKELPYGSAVAGRPNMVNSPYANKSQLVDVAGMSAGQTVKCPYSGKLFRVPPSQQAANKVESKIEAPAEKSPAKPSSDAAPKSEPKAEDKPAAEKKP
jgi:hypothetical protein